MTRAREGTAAGSSKRSGRRRRRSGLEPTDNDLTVNDIADTFRINQQSVRNWIDHGQLPAVRLGPRRIRIARADFDEFLSNEGPTDRAPTLRNPLAEQIVALQQETRALQRRVSALEREAALTAVAIAAVPSHAQDGAPAR